MKTTSLEAKSGVDITAQRAEVMNYVEACNDGATRDEISACLCLPIQSVTWRVRELLAAGRITESKNRRATRTGAKAFVLYARAQGRQTFLDF